MIVDFWTRSGSHYRVDTAKSTIECVAPDDAAFEPRVVVRGADHLSTRADMPEVGLRYYALFADKKYIRTGPVERVEAAWNASSSMAGSILETSEQ